MVVNAEEAKTLRHFLESAPIGAVFEETDLNVLGTLPISSKPMTRTQWSAVRGLGQLGPYHKDRLGMHLSRSAGRRPTDPRLSHEGDFLGFRTGLGFNYYTLISVTELSVLEISLDHLTESLLKSPRLAMTFMELMARQRAILIEHLISIGRRSALVRIAHLLLELGHRARINGTGDENHFFCPLTQSELADALGLTPIHINRMLRELREDDLLIFRNNEVEFLNRSALVHISSFDEHYLTMEIFPRVRISR